MVRKTEKKKLESKERSNENIGSNRNQFYTT